MASPESIAAAFARGMMEAMLSQPEKQKESRPKVVKTADVDAAVRRYIEELQAQEAAPEPQQEPLFPPPGVVDLGPEIYEAHQRKIAEAMARAEARERPADEMPPGFFDANEPGAKAWTGPNFS